MVWDTLPSLEAGRRVLSTVRLLDYRNPRRCDDDACTDWEHPDHPAAHPGWVPFRSWDQLLDARGMDVLMDEVVGVASSRASAALPGAIEAMLQKLRHQDSVLRWTAPAWARADVIIRETTQVVTQCRGYMPVSTEDGQDRLWRPRRLFSWRTYDRQDFSEFTDGDRQSLKPLVKQWFWGPGSDGFRAYQTLGDVLSVGTVNDSGRCVVCGGRRTVPMCSCDDRSRRAARAGVIPGGAPEGGAGGDPGTATARPQRVGTSAR
jgi:hypothetical protein